MESLEELIKKLEYAKKSTESCLENSEILVDWKDLSYWASEVERLRKEIKERL